MAKNFRAIKVISGRLFRETDSVTLVLELLFTTAVLFAFCAGWYKGNILLVITVTDGVPVLLYERYPVLYLIIPMTALVLLGGIVFSFGIYQNMAALQEERVEKIILENQITQMQSSMVEMDHLYDGIRSVKHDMKNHMAVLQNLTVCKQNTENRHKRGELYRAVTENG